MAPSTQERQSCADNESIIKARLYWHRPGSGFKYIAGHRGSFKRFIETTLLGGVWSLSLGQSRVERKSKWLKMAQNVSRDRKLATNLFKQLRSAWWRLATGLEVVGNPLERQAFKAEAWLGEAERGKLIQNEIHTLRSRDQNSNQNWAKKQASDRDQEIRHELWEKTGHLLTKTVQ